MIEKKFETELGTIHYWVSEKLELDKRTLVFLPGLTADHRLFDKQIEYFEGKENILVWDAPCHYLSRPFKMDFDLDDKARWLNEILELEGIRKPIIVGQSMGGYVGQVFVELFSNKLAGFVSIDSAPLQRKFMSRTEIWMLKHTEWMYRLYPWKALIRDGAKGTAETVYGQTLMSEMMDSYSHQDYAKLAGFGYRCLAKAVETNREYRFKCPVLLICGEKDHAGSCRRYDKAWAKDTGYRLEWIEGAGHNSNTDQPDIINKLIEEFVELL